MRRTIIVSDRSDWAGRVVEDIRELDLFPARVPWDQALEAADSIELVVLDVDGQFEERVKRLERWADRALQPVCIVSIVSGPGSGAFSSRTRELGYEHVLVDTGRRAYWDRLAAAMRRIVNTSAWLVPEVARALDCYEPAVVKALTIGLLMVPERVTVGSWADELKMRRQRLARTFSREDLPPPREILPWLKLLRVVEYAHSADSPVTRDDLARTVGYASGNYLGRVARNLTGRPLGDLLEAGVEGTLRLLSSRT